MGALVVGSLSYLILNPPHQNCLSYYLSAKIKTTQSNDYKNIQMIYIYLLNNIVQVIKRSKSFYLNPTTFNLILNKPINLLK
jgi:hypothetical protein